MKKRFAMVVLPVALVGCFLAGAGAERLDYLAERTPETDPTPALAEPQDELATSEVLIETLVTAQELDGNLGFGEVRDLVSRKAGLFTWLPEVGAIIRPGSQLWRVDEQAVLYLEGEIPMYRTLSRSARNGPDILQLEEFLIAEGLGPEGWVADNVFNATTRSAVRELQRLNGMTITGTLTTDQVFVGSGPLRIASVAQPGDDAGGAVAIGVTSATALVSVSASSTQLASLQQTPDVLIELPDGQELDAKLTEVIANPLDEDGRFSYTIQYEVSDPTAKAQPVKVRIERVLATDALTVPVDALLALAEGGYAVEVEHESGPPVLTAVEVIDFDDTRVAVIGNITAGDRVVVPS